MPGEPPFMARCTTDMDAPEHICSPYPGVYYHHRPESSPFNDGSTERTLTTAEVEAYFRVAPAMVPLPDQHPHWCKCQRVCGGEPVMPGERCVCGHRVAAGFLAMTALVYLVILLAAIVRAVTE